MSTSTVQASHLTMMQGGQLGAGLRFEEVLESSGLDGNIKLCLWPGQVQRWSVPQGWGILQDKEKTL